MPDALAVSPAANAAHLASARALLTAERRALTDIRRAATALTSGPMSPAATAHKIETNIGDVVLGARKRARAASRASMGAEWDVATRTALRAGVALPALPTPGETAADALAAIVVARELAAAYLASEANGAARVPRYALEEAATTQTAAAFGDERWRLEKLITFEAAGAEWLPAVIKFWRAELDRKICQRCFAVAGTIQPIGFDWDGLVPGSVHRRCRCFSGYMFAPLFMGRSQAAA